MASKGVPWRDKDRGRAAAPAMAPAGVDVALPTDVAVAVEVKPKVAPVGRFSLTDRYLQKKKKTSRQT